MPTLPPMQTVPGKNNRSRTELKFCLILSILFCVLQLAFMLRVFDHLHLGQLGLFLIQFLFTVTVLTTMLKLLKNRMTPLLKAGMLIYIGAYLVIFLLFLGYLMMWNRHQPSWLPYLLSGFSGIASLGGMLAAWELFCTHWQEMDPTFKCWTVVLGVLSLSRILMLAMHYSVYLSHRLHIFGSGVPVAGVLITLLSLLFPIFSGAIFLRELNRIRNEEKMELNS